MTAIRGEPTPQAHRAGLADLSLAATACMWAINILVVKYASQQMDALTFNAIRMVLSTIVLGICGLCESTPWRIPHSRRFYCFSLLSGLIYPLMFMTAIRWTTAGNTGLLLSSMPAWTALIARTFLHEQLPLASWWGLAISLLGSAAIAFSGGQVELTTVHLRGNVLMLSAAVCWASATVVSGRLLRQTSPIRLAFWSSILTTPVHLLIVSPQLPAVIPLLRSPHLTLSLLYSGVFSTGIAYATWHYGVRQLGASHAAIYQNVVTVVALIGSWLVLSETPRFAQVWGGLLIFAGILLVRRRHLLGKSSE